MGKYVLIYHQPDGYVPRADDGTVSAWLSFFEGIATHVVDMGQPVFERRSLGAVDAGTQLGGYSVVDADDLESAVRLAEGCPSLQYGGGVQVGELAEIPAGLAERIPNRVVRA
jgi:hypothetical protein